MDLSKTSNGLSNESSKGFSSEHCMKHEMHGLSRNMIKINESLHETSNRVSNGLSNDLLKGISSEHCMEHQIKNGFQMNH